MILNGKNYTREGIIIKDLNTLYRYDVYCVNSGPVDDDLYPNLVTIVEAQVNVKAPFIYTTACGITQEVKTDLSIAKADGNLFVLRDYSTKNFVLRIFNTNLYQQPTEPDTPQENDVWFNTCINPRLSYQYKSGDWELTDLVPIAHITGDIVTIYPYNRGKALGYNPASVTGQGIVEDLDEYLKFTNANTRKFTFMGDTIEAKSMQNHEKLTKVWISSQIRVIEAATIEQAPFLGCPNVVIYTDFEEAKKPEGWGEFWNYTDTETQAKVVWNSNRDVYNSIPY